MRDRSTFAPLSVLSFRKNGPGRHKSTPVPQKRRNLIGLRQVQRLPRCALCQGTYLDYSAAPCNHLHLAQRASRDLISASLSRGRLKVGSIVATLRFRKNNEN